MDEFNNLMKSTDKVEKELNEAEDSKKLSEVVTGSKSIYIEGYGELVFFHPSPKLAMDGDLAAAQFKTMHLRAQDLLTEAQLKAIYSQPVKVNVDGKEIVVGSGEWTDKDEHRLEMLPTKIDGQLEMLLSYREDYQKCEDSKVGVKKGKKMESICAEQKKAEDNARKIYDNIINERRELLDLQTKRLQLFSTSLEEQAYLEKVKIYAPACIKRDGKLLWEKEDDFLNDNIGAVRVLSLYNLFLRGVDISFFDDAPVEEISSPDTSMQKQTA